MLVLTACLDDGPVGPSCTDLTGEVIDTRGDTVFIDSGLRYRDTGVGAGLAAESCGADVRVDYSLSLLDGPHVETGELPLFTIGERAFLPAFEQGIIGMLPGATRQLIIEPSIGYGSQNVLDDDGNVVIPGGSTLIFDVELVSIE